MQDVHPVAAAGFGAAADVYERSRPSYPSDAVTWIVQHTGTGSGSTIVDVGAGTGKLTRLLVPTGARVIAVEPVPQMRAKLAERVPEAEVVDATAEVLPLEDGCADLVTAAQAFHWFDTERTLPELHRVLRPRGHLALIWNFRDVDDPLQAAIEELLAPLRREVETGPNWRPAIERSPLYGPIVERTFPFEQRLTAAELRDRVASTSFVATLPSGEREALLDRVVAVVAGRTEPFPFPYVTGVYVVQATAA